jgi:Zn-dependent peptidase ImmA (M78 family)
MLLIEEKIKMLGFGWNEKPLGEDDVYSLCSRFGVRIDESPMTVGGFYYRLLGQDFLAIDSRLSGPQKLLVLFHELGHFLLHVPDDGPVADFHHVGRRTRKEREADAFALCAILPRALIADRSPSELIEDGYPADLVAQRLKLFRKTGL